MNPMTLAKRGGLLLATGLLCLATPAALAQQSEPETTTQSPSPKEDPMRRAKRQVGALLRGHHHLPSATQIEAASPLARAALVELAQDEALFLLYRRRALIVLVKTWPDEVNRSMLEGLLAGEDDALVLESLNLLVAHYGEHGRDVLEETLSRSPYLTHRVAAVHALSALSRDEQEVLVNRALDVEQDADLRALLAIKAEELGR